MTTTPTSPAETLRGLCDGRVHLPADEAYDAARLPWNLAVEQRPAAVAVPRTVDEVAAVVRAAAAAGLRVAPQSTGHGAGPLDGRSLDDVVLLRLHELTGVTVDAEARTAHVVGGTLWQDVITEAAPHGLTASHGSAPDVAVAGYVLGGGLSFYGRTHGVAANAVRSADVVTADGSLVRASATENADLFWALRGGGCPGVVVGLEIDLLPYADVFAGMLLWDRERAPEVVPAWAAWSREAPDSATTSMRVMSFPPLPDLPPFLSGRQLVVIDGAVLEDDDRAAEILAPLRALEPEMDTFARIPAAGMMHVHMDPPQPSPAVSDHALLRELPDEAVAAFLGEVGPGSTSSLLFGELRQLGGAFAHPAADGGVVSSTDAAYVLYAIAMAPFPGAAIQGRADAAALRAALAPWSSERMMPTFTDGQEDHQRLYGDGHARLSEVRSAYDPTGLFVGNHAG